MTAHIFTDGASRANPGHAAYGVWVNELGRASWGEGVYLGDAITNNTAEFKGVLRGLELALELMAAYDVAGVVLHSDSDNTVKYLSGEYQVSAAHLVPLYEQAKAMQARATKPLSVRHIMREANGLADYMANEALDALGSVASLRATTLVTVGASAPPPSQTRPAPARKIKRKRR